jgi:hypothetical protein
MALTAQVASPAAPSLTECVETASSDPLFWPVVLVILLVVVVIVLVKRLSPDRCMKLLRSHHVTALLAERSTVWGDLLVRTQGAEVTFDELHQTQSGLVESSVLLYEDELAKSIALCRVEFGLTEEERALRLEQIERTFKPPFWRRAHRKIRNAVGILRDALSKSVGMFIGRMTPRGIVGTSFRARSEDISARVSELITNTYEPVLEPHIGQRVVLEICAPEGATSERLQFPGYLVDYTAKYVAVFNTDHSVERTHSLELPCTPEQARAAGLAIDERDECTQITCLGPLASVIVSAQIPGATLQLAVVLLPGTCVHLPSWPRPVHLIVHETRLLDLVCPRSRARVRNGSAEAAPQLRWRGVAPLDTQPLHRRSTP